jgi:hypothetical protein
MDPKRVAEIEAMAVKRRSYGRPESHRSFHVSQRVSLHVGQSVRAHGEDCNAKLFKQLMDILRGMGWKVTLDPEIVKNYRLLVKYNRVGEKGDLRFKARYYEAGLEIKFWPNYGGDNRNGPEYGSDHYGRATYLDKKRLDHVVGMLADRMRARSFEDRTEPAFADPREEVEYRVRSCWHFKEHDVSNECRPDMQPYNRKDQDGVELTNGMTRYFFGWNGELMRGVVYHNINNMWWVIAGKQVTNVSSGDLFSYDPVRCRPRYQSRGMVSRMRRKLEGALRTRDYRLAEILTQKLWRIDGGLPGEEPWVLIKGGLYYRGGYCGYTNDLATAGLYTRVAAERHAAGCSGEVKARPLVELARSGAA